MRGGLEVWVKGSRLEAAIILPFWADMATHAKTTSPVKLTMQIWPSCLSIGVLLRSHKATADAEPTKGVIDHKRTETTLSCRWLGDQFYKEAIEHCRSYNARLCAERSVRLPFLDSQTGVAQNNCYIWMERMASGQMYTYPARCWRKKRRLHTPVDPQLRLCELRLEGELAPKKESLPMEGTTLEALLRGESLERKGTNNNPKEDESLLEIQRVLEADENGDGYHDDEDFEVDTPKRKHRSKGRGRGSGRRKTEAASVDDQDKPYVCDSKCPLHAVDNTCCKNRTDR
ncbi:hypothetical protein JZ751_002845 [Albula glossodonta]|uniref:DPF1-3 N-terminal domain-containing protein n=1 Tax=Albula glossodonta TaxID=121402 RepID=A0A8T2NFP9_9TELE|nr:hypothetical protein JZ751_002845 [Albula glossodonta]